MELWTAPLHISRGGRLFLVLLCDSTEISARTHFLTGQACFNDPVPVEPDCSVVSGPQILNAAQVAFVVIVYKHVSLGYGCLLNLAHVRLGHDCCNGSCTLCMKNLPIIYGLVVFLESPSPPWA